MTDIELLNAIRGIVKEEINATIEPLKADVINIIEPLKVEVSNINGKLDIIEEKLVDMDNAVGVIADWIEKSADLNRVPFLKAE